MSTNVLHKMSTSFVPLLRALSGVMYPSQGFGDVQHKFTDDQKSFNNLFLYRSVPPGVKFDPRCELGLQG
jgi:hypothetical protein